MWKRQEDVQKTVTCLIQTQELINQPAPQLQSAGFPSYLGSEQEDNIPSLFSCRYAEMVAWKASLIFTDYFIAALSYAFTVLPGPDRPLPQWYLLTKRTRFASLHPPFRWSKLPISAGRIPFLLKSVFLTGKPPLYRVKSSIFWVNSTICMVKWS